MGIEEIVNSFSPESSLSPGNSSDGTLPDDNPAFTMLKFLDSIPHTRRIRQKLKTSMTKKTEEDGRSRPMIVKHPSNKQFTSETLEHHLTDEALGWCATENQKACKANSPKRHHCRTPPPLVHKNDPLFTDCKISLRRSHSIVGPRRRSPSTPRSRPSSPCSSTGSFKGPSPAGSLDNLYVETVYKRVQKAYKARLYLLWQPGPHSFFVGGDSPEHKFKTIIGPQTCTCGRGPHCIHLLFVMLRVFKISESDPRLWSKQLKNFEVDSLFAQYEKERQSRIKKVGKPNKGITTPDRSDASVSSSWQNMTTCNMNVPENSKSDSVVDEGEMCPICLLDMVDGESLVSCVTGCKNKLHHHCISIWAEECRRQKEPILCPLCRAPWLTTTNSESGSAKIRNDDIHDHLDMPASSSQAISFASAAPSQSRSTASNHQQNTATKPLLSPSSEPSTNFNFGLTSAVEHQAFHSHTFVRSSSSQRSPSHVRLPRCHSVIGKEHSKMATLWQEVFGAEFVNCLYSRDWKMRETALRWLHREVLQEMMFPPNVRNGKVYGDGVDQHSWRQDRIQCLCQILALVAADPVYRVYLACLQCLRMMLAYVPIKMETDLKDLQDLVQPVVNTVLLRCSDRTKASQLSIATLLEMCKGQNGELAVGRHTPYPADVEGIGGVTFVLKCIFDRIIVKGGHSWQWILGRLNVLEKLLEEYPQEFYLVLVPPHQKRSGSVDFSGSPIASRQERLMAVLHFALDALHVSHATVVKQAREVFFKAAHFASTVPSVAHQVYAQVLTNPLLEGRLGTWVRDQLGNNVVQRHLSSEGRLSGNVTWRRPSTETHLGCNPDCCAELQRSFHMMSKRQPHLPSCGGVSPTKGLDRSYFMEKLNALVLGDARPSSQWLSNTRNNSCNDNAISQSSSSWIPSFCHQHCEGLSKNSKVINTANRRPNFLPLDGTFRDVLEWERVAGKSSPSLARPSRYRSPTRFDKKVSPIKKQRESDWKSSLPPSQFSMASRTPSGLDGGMHSRTQPTIKKQSSGSTNLSCTCSREMRKTPDQSQRNHRLCYKKLNGVIGPLLPSLVSPGRIQKDSLSLELPTGTAFSTDSVSDEMLEMSEASKIKQEVGLQDAVTPSSPIKQSSELQKRVVIPQLMQYDDDNKRIIHVEPEEIDEELYGDQSCGYVETIHWKKGLLLGTGAFSTCYHARDLQTGTLMAVKQVFFCRNCPDDQEKVMAGIKEEIALMAQLDHPNIVRLLGATQQHDHFNMFVEWMPGGSVSCLLDKYGSFSEPVIINYTQQVLQGLAYLHDHQVLHRDLKGANLLVDSTGHNLRIGDFGAAARLASQATVAGEFQGQLLGTIAFMAPEVLRGEDYGRSCDIWSVGCAMIEMATTKPPWNENDVSNHLALIYKIARANESPPIPKDLSPSTRDLALRCLEIKSEDRPPAKDLLRHPVFCNQNL